LTTTSTFI